MCRETVTKIIETEHYELPFTRTPEGKIYHRPFGFFFSSRRRHTRWPRDWSSDVCSSDLCCTAAAGRHCAARAGRRRRAVLLVAAGAEREQNRSEERRVGKECRSRWSP